MVTDFHSDSIRNIFGLSKDAGREGLDLGISSDKKVKVRHMINMEPGENLASEEQLYKRIVRSNMGGDSFVYNLIYENIDLIDQTIDEYMIYIIRIKKKAELDL